MSTFVVLFVHLVVVDDDVDAGIDGCAAVVAVAVAGSGCDLKMNHSGDETRRQHLLSFSFPSSHVPTLV